VLQLQLLQCSLYSLLGSPAHHDRGSFLYQRCGNREPNTSGAARDQCLLSFQLEVHENSMLWLFPMIQHNRIL
jgi:hypothetical protein